LKIISPPLILEQPRRVRQWWLDVEVSNATLAPSKPKAPAAS